MHERPGEAAGSKEIHDQVERLRMQDGRRLEIFSGRRRACKNEDSRTDDGTDAERRQRPRPERLTEPGFGVLRVRDQFVDGLAAQRLGVGGTNDDGCWLSG